MYTTTTAVGKERSIKQDTKFERKVELTLTVIDVWCYRSESSSSSPAKNDTAEVEEYFRTLDMKSNRKLRARNSRKSKNSKCTCSL